MIIINEIYTTILILNKIKKKLKQKQNRNEKVPDFPEQIKLCQQYSWCEIFHDHQTAMKREIRYVFFFLFVLFSIIFPTRQINHKNVFPTSYTIVHMVNEKTKSMTINIINWTI